ncbi:conserved oligomeric Golgi complex subunit 7 isoform X2 [Dendroctonus ponderosae]|uniref:conserved oligomeric Golgi complex subunit 7 isoform X2 n=1 Tax=Dendroctonus ponderosae TaxID=77166 RepID=UPI00203539C9|nr:conserved oligomeric Golgi complex subunit 7 isoform X2 [Dendroctonus ponderosae]
MDISSFSSDSFDIKQWVNNTLKSGENQDKKDFQSNYTMSLVMKLQLYVQQVNNSLENSSQQVLASLPKIMHDAKILQQEALVLKEKMGQVKEEIVQIEQDTRKSINTIEKLDEMKNQLTIAKQGLHESDNWTVLVNDLEEIFDSKNIEAISSKILGMQSSLKLLVNVADFEDRKLQLEGLKNRLEAIASPVIVQAFTTSDAEASVKFVHIFSSIGRITQLVKYYHNCQKDALVKKWRTQLELEQDESVVQWIHNYHGILLSNWHTQCKWFNQVFIGESAVDSLINIYVDVLTFLHDVKQVSKQFAENLWNVIEQSSSGKTDASKVEALTKTIYRHLMVYVCKYAAYEQASLVKHLNTLHCMKDELPDTIQALGLSANQVMDHALEARKRCQQFTENCGFCGLLIALRAYFSTYAGYFRVALRQIDRSKRLKENWNTFQLSFSLLQHSGDVLLKVQHLEKELTMSILELNKPNTSIKFKHFLLDAENLKEYESLIKCVTEGTQLSLLDYVTKEFNKLCTDVHHTTYQVVFGPVSAHLEIVSASETWAQFDGSSLHNSDLPDYSFSPQEYITQIGQYLLELPQHLEPFLFKENPALTCALKAIDQEYADAPDREGALAQIFLQKVARGICNSFAEKVLSISTLSQPASRQLSHDINYLNNVLQDLGITMSENLQQLLALLKIPPDQYQVQSIGYSAKYVAGIRQIRHLMSN